MTTQERMFKAMTEKGLLVTVAGNTLIMLSYNQKMETTYIFNENGDLVDYKTRNL